MVLATLFIAFLGGVATYETSAHRHPLAATILTAFGLAIFSIAGSAALLAAQQLSERRRSIIRDFLNDELRSSPAGPSVILDYRGNRKRVLSTALGLFGVYVACFGAGTHVAPPTIPGDPGMYLSKSFVDSNIAAALMAGGAIGSILLIPLWFRVFRFPDVPWLDPTE